MKTSEQKSLSPRTKDRKSQNKTCSALLQTAATGELEGGYREIVQVLQGNPFGPTVKSLRGYRKIRFGIPSDLHLDNGIVLKMGILI